MFKIFKYLKLIGLFRNVADAYEEHTGKDRPAYLSRRFIGALIILIGAGLSLHFGVKIDEGILTNITEGLDRIVCACIVLYGAVMEVIGIVKRKKKGK